MKVTRTIERYDNDGNLTERIVEVHETPDKQQQQQAQPMVWPPYFASALPARHREPEITFDTAHDGAGNIYSMYIASAKLAVNGAQPTTLVMQ